MVLKIDIIIGNNIYWCFNGKFSSNVDVEGYNVKRCSKPKIIGK